MDAAIDIYTEKRVEAFPWILKRAAIELHEAIPGSALNPSDSRGGIAYFVNHGRLRPVKGVSIAHLTHLEDHPVTPRALKSRASFLVALDTCQWFTVTCEQTRYIAIDHGVDTDSIVNVRYGADDRLLKPLKFGVVGRVYETGRKGEHLAAALRKDGYNVVSWGKGWPVPEMFPGSRWETLPDFYREIDYLIVTSLNEGGPVPVIDAIAAGVPVIAPDVGWCWSYPVIPYEVGDLDSLRHVLSKLSNPPTWQGWIDDHIELFRRVRES